MARKPLPIYLLAGGRATKRGTYAALLRRIFALTGAARPKVAYVGAATDDDAQFLGWMNSFFTAGGACDFELAPFAGRRRSLAAARRVLEAADLVFVGGGDVEAGMRWLARPAAAALLEKRWRAGAPLVGVSAGAIMLASQWVRWRDPDDDSTAAVFDCLGLAKTLCDTHGEADGWPELRALLRLKGRGAVGYGIRTDAAIAVSPAGKVEVLQGEVDRLRG
jgi:peptidase E